MDRQDELGADAIHVGAQTGSGAVHGSTARKSQNPKRFECTHPGCNRRFTRMEHMQRHSLNHTAGESTCPRCSATFKRPDLLERHMHRHRQRDLEAGGPGCGTLDTRKRSWRAPDGSVVQKRPRPAAEATGPWTAPGLESSIQVVSPPVSDEGRSGHHYELAPDNEDYFDGAFDVLEASALVPPCPAPAPYAQPEFDYGFHPTVPASRPQLSSNNAQLEYHPAFQPDTSSSFNMPYTTALDYNWLFNLEAATASGFGLTSAGAGFQEQSTYDRHQVEKSPRPDVTAAQQPAQNPTPESRESGTWRPWTEDPLSDSPRREARYPPDMSSSSTQTDLSQRQPYTPTRGANARDAAIPSTREKYQSDRGQGVSANGRGDNVRNIHPALMGSNQSTTHILERPLSMLSVPKTLPQIDNAAHERLLAVVEAAHPIIPDQSSESPIRDHPLLSLNSLQSWLDLYFTQFNAAYPLIHLPTFDPGQVEPLLLLSIVLLGATYSDKNAHQLAVCIHDVIRPSIFAHAGFSPRPELWTLQTILLVECFGKSRAGQKQHDMSHLFHGLLINLIRRSDCQSIANTPGPVQDAAEQDKAWRQWAEAEQKKRLALLCFMWDTQHAVLFCQSLCMSAFELRCGMPCHQSLWEAPDAGAWESIWQQSFSSTATSKPAVPMFLPMLKSYLTPVPGSYTHQPKGMNALSLVLILHGLMSIAWDMQRRDQTSLGVNSIIGATTWKDLISKAYDRWKVDFDMYCHDAAVVPAQSTEDTASEWSDFTAAYGAIYHSAQALLYMDFLDVQIYAGARHILGRPVQQQDYIRSSKVVKRWATNDKQRAATAAWHAANMLRDVVTPNKTSQAGPAGTRLADALHTSLFHVPWCLYLATLVCWAFHHAKQGRKRSEEDDIGIDEDSVESDDEIVWDSQREMEVLVAGMAGSGKPRTSMRDILATQGRRGTNGLVWVIADVLAKVRWGIVHSGVVVLRGLVPMRLINQYETM